MTVMHRDPRWAQTAVRRHLPQSHVIRGQEASRFLGKVKHIQVGASIIQITYQASHDMHTKLWGAKITASDGSVRAALSPYSLAFHPLHHFMVEHKYMCTLVHCKASVRP